MCPASLPEHRPDRRFRARHQEIRAPVASLTTAGEASRRAGRAVRERRLALGLSQVEVATRAGMTQPALSRLEAGGVIPTIPLLDRIFAALDADLIVEIAPHAA
jgi:ribosome-binding protein aMBF1 (putative translation factor)